jgi:hypothetical protein
VTANTCDELYMLAERPTFACEGNTASFLDCRGQVAVVPGLQRLDGTRRARTADIEVCDLPRLEESSRALIIKTVGQAAGTALVCQADRADPSVFL